MKTFRLLCKLVSIRTAVLPLMQATATSPCCRIEPAHQLGFAIVTPSTRKMLRCLSSALWNQGPVRHPLLSPKPPYHSPPDWTQPRQTFVSAHRQPTRTPQARAMIANTCSIQTIPLKGARRRS